MRLKGYKCSDRLNDATAKGTKNRIRTMNLQEAFEELAQGRKLEEVDLDQAVRSQLAEYGVWATDGMFSPPQHELLEQDAIETKLLGSTREWLRRLDVLSCTESTNSDLLELSRERDIDGWVRTSEVQTGGRGRRGRQWVSPFAKNVALSVGISIDRSTAEIGSISLAIGLMAARVLEDLEIEIVECQFGAQPGQQVDGKIFIWRTIANDGIGVSHLACLDLFDLRVIPDRPQGGPEAFHVSLFQPNEKVYVLRGPNDPVKVECGASDQHVVDSVCLKLSQKLQEPVETHERPVGRVA